MVCSKLKSTYIQKKIIYMHYINSLITDFSIFSNLLIELELIEFRNC